MNLFEGMENFISDTEIYIKQKMMCRICFLYRFGFFAGKKKALQGRAMQGL